MLIGINFVNYFFNYIRKLWIKKDEMGLKNIIFYGCLVLYEIWLKLICDITVSHLIIKICSFKQFMLYEPIMHCNSLNHSLVENYEIQILKKDFIDLQHISLGWLIKQTNLHFQMFLYIKSLQHILMEIERNIPS